MLVLENLTFGMKAPRVMDIKIGSRLHDIDATPEKIKSRERNSASTSSASLGFRICGMLMDGRKVMKSDVSFFDKPDIEKALNEFVKGSRDRILTALVQLRRMKSIIKNHSLQLISASVLMVFDEDTNCSVACRIIDFAHSHYHRAEFYDSNFLSGLDSLICCLQSIVDGRLY